MSMDRRRFTRVTFQTDVRLECEGRTLVTRDLYNLSIGGCLMRLEEGLALEAPCSVEIVLGHLEEGLVIRVEGQIVRSDHMTAIKFLRIDPDSLFHLQNIIRYNAVDTDLVDNEIEKHPGLR